MNPYQSTLYQLTESVGAVSMVSTDQIKKQQNLDYLQHLCCFIQRMNINPIWFQNQQPNNKLKILEIYQLAINYSNNLSLSYRKELEEKEAVVAALRKSERDKVAAIRNQKEEYLSMKERYKLKKHQMYKYMYDNLKHKIREEEQEREYRRQQHRQPTATATPEIVYYYPNDPNYHQYPQYPPNFTHQPSMHSQVSNPYQNQQFPPLWNPQSGPPTENMNNAANNPYFLDPNNRQQQNSERGRPESYRYNEFLNTGELQTGSNKIPQIITTKDVIQASLAREKDEMEKSNIIDSGEKLMQKMGKQVKQNEKSINRSNASKKRQSGRLDSREDDDEFGDLTLNSRKRDSIKAVEKNSDIEYDQEQFDSIAHIKLVSDSSAKPKDFAPNRFQSKIQAVSPRTQQQQQLPTKKQPEVASNTLNVQQNDPLKEMGFSTSIMHSKFSKNNKQATQQVQKLNQEPPKRNSQTIRKSNLPPQPAAAKQDDLRQSNQSNKAKETTQSNSPERLNDFKPKRNTQPRQQNQKPQEVSIVQTVDITDQNFDIYHSNAGKVQSRKFQKPKQSVNIYNSNVGYASSNSKAQPIQKLNQQKPKRASQIESPILEVPQPSKSNSNNTLKVSIAESQQMRNSNMLYSQATSMKFSKEPSKTPPKLEKQSAEKPEEEEDYKDDFDDIDDFQIHQLEQSHLPVSNNNKPKPEEKSQVEINISMVPTTKELIKEKYLKLSNEVFQLKNENQLVVPNKVAASVTASSNLGESDSFFDEILEIPMNSKIAKRPSVIHKFSPSKINNKTKTVESLKKIPQQKFSSMSNINSPSIHVIDPTGNVEKVIQRGVKEQQKFDNKPKENIKTSIKLQEFIDKSVPMRGKQTSLLVIDPPQIKQQAQRIKTDEDDEINFNLIEKSNIGDNSYQRQGGKKILELINKIETQSPTIKDARAFNDGIFDRILKERMKVGVNAVKTTQKWEEVQAHFKKELEKVKSELQQRRNQERSEEVSTPNSRKKQSFYDDLVYSQSNAKFQERSSKKEQQSIDPVRELTQSITIKEPLVLQEKPAPKAATDNKYSRSNKPKVQIKNEIRKNINEGKNAYDVDDPLNVAVYQNKNLFENREEDQDSDF